MIPSTQENGSSGYFVWARERVLQIYDAGVNANSALPSGLPAAWGQSRNEAAGLFALGRFCAAHNDGHVYRTARMACRLGARLGLNAQALGEIGLSALLHDIGKMALSPDLLFKTETLSADEFKLVQHHTILGRDLIMGLPSGGPVFAADVALFHHEHWDGSGYPYGVSGENIPLHARIVAIADITDALLSARPYKRPWPAVDVREWISRHAASRFDPEIYSVFMENFDTIIRKPGRGLPDGTILLGQNDIIDISDISSH